ncbi:MAG: molybdate ABC transporter permease subunit, partial [Sandaracinus sp.]|nr:molybdate ABC transporter permease subunit [Sandaracinus sp.]
MNVDVTDAILISLRAALFGTSLAAPVALGLGHLLARRTFPGRSLLAAALFVPLVLPPVVTGYLLLALFGRGGPLGFLDVPFHFAACVVAAFFVSLPLFVLSARQAFEAVDPRYEEVAATLGSPRAATFRRVTLPLALPGLAAGATLAFARALGEFGATVVLAGNLEGETRTLSLAVYALLETPDGDDAARTLVLASLALSTLSVVLYEVFRRRARLRLEL